MSRASQPESSPREQQNMAVILSVLAKDLRSRGTASRSFMSTFRITIHISEHFQSSVLTKDLETRVPSADRG